MIEAPCACGSVLKVKEEHAGKKVRCRKCGKPVAVPAVPAAPEVDLLPASPPPKPAAPLSDLDLLPEEPAPEKPTKPAKPKRPGRLGKGAKEPAPDPGPAMPIPFDRGIPQTRGRARGAASAAPSHTRTIALAAIAVLGLAGGGAFWWSQRPTGPLVQGKVTGAWLRILASGAAGEKKQAAAALAEHPTPDPEALLALALAARDKEAEVSTAGKAALEAMAARSKDPDAPSRFRQAMEKTVAALVAQVKDATRADVDRDAAALGLTAAGPIPLETVQAAMADTATDATSRRYFVIYLHSQGLAKEETAPVPVAGTETPAGGSAMSAPAQAVVDATDVQARAAAASALQESAVKDPAAASALLELMTHADPGVRAVVVPCLGRLGQAAAAPDATEELKTFVRDRLAYALVQAVDDADPQVRRAAIREADPGASGGAAAYSKAFADPDESIRQEAETRLSQAGEAGVAALCVALGHADAPVRARAARTIAKLGAAGRVALSTLQQAAQDPDPEVQKEVAAAVAALKE